MHDKNSTARSGAMTDPPPHFSQPREKSSADRIHTTNYQDQDTSTKKLYAIIDAVTNSIIGGIQIHFNTASAIRILHDIANNPETMLNKHPLDFDLWLLGELGPDHRLTSDLTRIISGAQIATMIQTPETKQPRRAD